MRCPTPVNGNNIIFSTRMSYDTGCTSIVIHTDEILSFVQIAALWSLNQTSVITATGVGLQNIVTLQVRVLNSARTRVLRDWQAMNALVMDSGERIGSKPLAD